MDVKRDRFISETEFLVYMLWQCMLEIGGHGGQGGSRKAYILQNGTIDYPVIENLLIEECGQFPECDGAGFVRKSGLLQSQKDPLLQSLQLLRLLVVDSRVSVELYIDFMIQRPLAGSSDGAIVCAAVVSGASMEEIVNNVKLAEGFC
ncbi:hypothetical protein Tco_0196131 [Tanacetum coccineum]